MMLKEILTVEELAKAFRLDARSIYRKVKANKLPHVRVGKGGAIRFVRDEVIKALSVQVSA